MQLTHLNWGARIVVLIGAIGVLAACRTAETESTPTVTPIEQQALTPPAQVLREDTIEALTYDRATGDRPYVGVWTTSIAGCAMVDQTQEASPIVITPAALRQDDETCKYEESGRQGNRYSLAVMCRSDSLVEHQDRVLTLTGKGSMRLTTADGLSETSYIRCRLPEQRPLTAAR